MGIMEAISKALSIFDRWQESKEKRYRTEIDKLKKEKKALMKGKCTKETSARVVKIEEKIEVLTSYLKN